MTPEEQISALLEPVLGDHVDDVAFADLVDEVLDDLAARVAAVLTREAV
jgi:hypothetical protein